MVEPPPNEEPEEAIDLPVNYTDATYYYVLRDYTNEKYEFISLKDGSTLNSYSLPEECNDGSTSEVFGSPGVYHCNSNTKSYLFSIDGIIHTYNKPGVTFLSKDGYAAGFVREEQLFYVFKNEQEVERIGIEKFRNDIDNYLYETVSVLFETETDLLLEYWYEEDTGDPHAQGFDYKKYFILSKNDYSLNEVIIDADLYDLNGIHSNNTINNGIIYIWSFFDKDAISKKDLINNNINVITLERNLDWSYGTDGYPFDLYTSETGNTFVFREFFYKSPDYSKSYSSFYIFDSTGREIFDQNNNTPGDIYEVLHINDKYIFAYHYQETQSSRKEGEEIVRFDIEDKIFETIVEFGDRDLERITIHDLEFIR